MKDMRYFEYLEKQELSTEQCSYEEWQMMLATEEAKNYMQLCVWPGTPLGDYTSEMFINSLQTELFPGCRFKYAEEVITIAGDGGEGGRVDQFFYVHTEDIGKIAVKRLQMGIRWWEDVLGNLRQRNAQIYPQTILDKYPMTWNY